MRKLLVIFLIVSLVIVGLYFIWWKLPIEINRKSEIKHGNKVIRNIENYKQNQGHLPKSDDWKTLKGLGIHIINDISKPEYKNINDTIYELYFIEGFDGPYLKWNSEEKKWKIGM